MTNAMTECDFHSANRREHLAFLLGEAQQLILSPDADADKKCVALLSRACELMRVIEDSNQ